MSTATRQPGAGWTPELVKKVLAGGGKIEPFNRAYVRIFARRPTFPPAADPLNRFFQEGAPEFSAPSLVPAEVAAAVR